MRKNEIQDIERNRRIRIFRFFSALITSTLIAFIAISWIEGNYFRVIIDCAALSLVAGNYGLFLRLRRVTAASLVAVLVTGILLLVLLYSDGQAALWSFTFPWVVFFILGRRIGAVIGTAFLSIALVLVVISPVHYSFDFQLRFAVLLFLLHAGTYFYERTRRVADSRLHSQSEALRESESFSREIISSVREGIIVVDSDLRYTLWNKYMEEITGVAAREVIGKTFTEAGIFSNAKEHELDRLLERALRGETIQSPEIPYHNPSNGSSGWIVGLYSPHLNSGGAITGAVVIVREITVQKELEERLRQSQKLETIGQLAGGVAHDFNNQLMSISGYTEMLKAAVAEGTVERRYADNIMRGVQRSADLTRKLLAFARKGKYKSVIVNIHDLIDEAIEILGRSIDKKIAISKCLSAGHPFVMGDATQLQNAILNIGLNGRDAMPAGGELVFATDIVKFGPGRPPAEPLEVAPGNYVRISVSDTGIGMGDDIKKHLFEPFFTTKEPGKGTGMGLASVYGTVASHNGSINVRSEPEKGTAVTLLLPLAEEHRSVSGGCADTRDKNTGESGATILLVEDEIMVREMTEEMLKRLGYRVVCCVNGLDGVDYYEKARHETDLVILDMFMPKMNGKEALYAMRRINPEVKVIISSGFVPCDDSPELIIDRNTGFIAKPFKMAVLSATIGKMLEGGNRNRKPAAM